VSRPPTLIVDFDGVIHAYTSPWTEATDINDGPVDGAIDWLKAMIAQNVHIVLFTARLAEGRYPIYRRIQEWLLRHGIEESELARMTFHTGKPHGTLYIDDRAYRFRGRFPSIEEVHGHEQWNKAAAEAVLTSDLHDVVQAALHRGVTPSDAARVLRELAEDL